MTLVSEKTPVLSATQVHQKIRRIAFEILESNFDVKELTLVGIDGQGYVLAGLLQKELKGIAPWPVSLARVVVDKAALTQPEVVLDVEVKTLKKKAIVLVDDVLNTGKTLAFALRPFLSVEIKKIQVAVLVNRSHSQYPMQPTFTGFELATTLKDHVEVVLGKNSAVYLT
ncbi:MAG: phosphoribosyltransferase [Cyclobacteriaceae bacterium]|jgi:pyrimidine operon attenuation protein/uracil phosphoribosyltransferase|nr:phosphoribosyltransferase [Cyclobacteriaceae bacterium]